MSKIPYEVLEFVSSWEGMLNEDARSDTEPSPDFAMRNPAFFCGQANLADIMFWACQTHRFYARSPVVARC